MADMSRKAAVALRVDLDTSGIKQRAEEISQKIKEALERNKSTEDPRIAALLKDLKKLDHSLDITKKSLGRLKIDPKTGQSLSQVTARVNESREAALAAKKAYDDYIKSLESTERGRQVMANIRNIGSEDTKAKYFGANADKRAMVEQFQALNAEVTRTRFELKAVQEEWGRFDARAATSESGIAKSLERSTDEGGILLLRLNELENKYEDTGKAAGKSGNNFRSSFYLARTIINDINRSLRKTVDRFKDLAKHIGNTIKQMFHLNSGSKSLVKTLQTGFKHALRNLLRYVFGVRSLYFLFRRLRGYAKDALGEIAKQFPEVNAQMSRVAQSLNQMKGAIGTAVQPLLNVLAPALEKIAALVTKVANAIASLFALITGQKVIYSATAGAVDYAASLDKTGSSAKKAKKELEGYLSPIDEINKYQSKKDDEDSGSGSGAGGGGITYQEIPIDPKILDLFERLKKMWETGNFYALGKEWGEKLRDLLESIPWDKIRDTANKLGKSLATLLGGFLEVERLGYDIGSTIAQSINTVFELINGFVTNFPWESLGSFIAQAFNGLFETIDWELIKETVLAGLDGIYRAVVKFIQNFNWDNISTTISNGVNIVVAGLRKLFDHGLDLKDRGFSSSIENYEPKGTVFQELGRKLGEQFRKTVENIDWEALGNLIGAFIQDAIDFAKNFLLEQDWETMKQAMQDLLSGFFNKINTEDLAKIIAAVIGAAILKAVGLAIKFVAAKKFGEAILGSIFGGGTAGGGAGAGGGAAAAGAGGLSLGGGVAGAVLMQIVGIFSIIGSSIQQIKDGVNWLNVAWSSLGHFLFGFWQGYNPLVATALQAVVTTVVGHWDELKSSVSEKWEAFKANILPNIKSFFGSIISFLVNVFIKRDLANAWIDVKTIFTSGVNIIKSIFGTIKGLFNSAKTFVSGLLTTIKAKLDAFWNAIKTSTKSTMSFALSTVTTIVTSIKDALSGAFEGIKGFWNGIVDKLNGNYTIGTLSFPVNLPRLAQGAVLPANKPFMAMVGDQKNGTNIETPLDTMVEAFNTALAKNGGSGTTTINFVLPDRRKIAQYVLEGGKIIQTSTGSNPFQLA